MKTKSIFFILCIILFFVFQVKGQQIGDGRAITINNFNIPLLSGIYQTEYSQVGFPGNQSPSWNHLFVLRHSNYINNYQLQLASSYVENDKLFFRKIAEDGLAGKNSTWHEVATRGSNIFNGNQYINGIVHANEIKVENTRWPDFVFSEDYKLPSISEVAKHIAEKKHLPGIPSEKEVSENGIDLGMMNAKLLQKIEELTLYVIQLKMENEEIKSEIAEMKK